MKTPSVVKPIQAAAMKARDRQLKADSGVAASRAQGEVIIRKLAWVGTAAAAMLVGKLLQLLYSKVTGVRSEHARFTHEDAKLDSALEDSMDASDAVAKY